jgi:hypothetical protein
MAMNPRKSEGVSGDGDPTDDDAEVLPSRIVLSLWLIAIVVVIVAGNFSDIGVEGRVREATQPIRTITGLNQTWGVFAPNPRGTSQYVDGRVDFDDGTSATYPIPKRRGLGAYVDYRWHKFQERLFPDDGAHLWSGYAEYLADRGRDSGRNPVRVTLIRRWAEPLPPGPGPEHGPWHEQPVFVLDLDR